MTSISRPVSTPRALVTPRVLVAAFSGAMERAADSLKATIRDLAERGQFGPSSELLDARDAGARA
jgi:hypothetical protein